VFLRKIKTALFTISFAQKNKKDVVSIAHASSFRK